MTPIEQMAKAIRKEFVDHIVDHANPHWGAQKPDYLVDTLKKAGYPKPEEAADFFADSAARAVLVTLAKCELPGSVLDAAGVTNDILARNDFRAMLLAIAKDGTA
jgi:hypothetical protein